jgi:RHS repeat-associated protein
VVEILGRQPSYGFAGIGVSTAIGNFTQTSIDLAFPAGLQGLLDWQRTYNSHSGAIGALGPGWSTSFSARVVAPPGGEPGPVTFYDEDGRQLPFTPAAGGGYAPPQDLAATLTRNVDGSFTLAYTSGEAWSFDATGRLTGRSLEGQQVSLDYDGTGLLLRASHSLGRSLAFGYDPNRRLTSVQASDGRAVSFGYGPGTVTDSLLESVTLPGGGTFQFESSGQGQASQVSRITDADGNLLVANTYDAATSRVTSQQYQATGAEAAGVAFAYQDSALTTVTTQPSGARVTFQADAAGRMVTATDAGGYSATFSYDGNGYLTTAVTPGGTRLTQTRDASGNLMTSEFGGATASWTYDDAGRVSSATSPVGGVTSYSYEGTGRIPARISDPNGGVSVLASADGLITGWTDADGTTTTYGYSPAGDLTSITRPAGGVTTLTRDAAGQLTALTAPSGATSQWSYDGTGRVISSAGPDGATFTFSYSAGGLLRQQTAPGNVAISYGYDTAGNLTSVTDALGNQSTLGYDALGNLTSMADENGNVTQYAYNDLGQLTSITEPDGAVSSFTYDADGNMVRTQGPAGISTATYDARGNNLSVTDETNATVHYSYDAADRMTSLSDALGRTWQVGYDAAGSTVSATDPSAASARFSWTAAGRLAGTTDPLGRQVSYTHDADGRVTAVTDAQGGVTQFAYDQDGRRIAEITPAGLRTSYAYDAAGRVSAVTDPRGWITRTRYDASGRRVAVITPAGLVTRYGYDAAGRLISMTDGNGSVTRYGYDPAGQLISMTNAKEAVTRYGYDAAGRLTSVTDPLSQTTTRAYDASGNLVTLTDPAGHEQHMAYDADGRVTHWTADGAVTVSYTYDAAGQRTSMTDATGTTRYTYDPNGNLLTITGPDGEQVTATFDAAGQRTSLSYPGGLTTSFTYDTNRRLIGLADSRAGDAVYALDPDGRLLTEQLPGRRARRYHYEGGLLRQFAVIRDGHPVSETAFSHDPDGRILAQRDERGIREFRYDGAGQLVFTGLRDGSPHDHVHLVYDAVGNRVGLRHGGTETRYVYDDACQLTSLGTRGRRVEFHYDPSGRLAERLDGERREVTTYNGFGLPAEITWTGRGETEVIRPTFDGDGLLAGLVLTSLDERRNEERAASVRYRWASGDQIPQILTQRARPALDDAEHDRPGDLDADFAYGYGRTFATSEHTGACFQHDGYGSQVRTEGTRDWAQAEDYDAFGVPVEPRPHESGGPRYGGPESPPSPAPELPRFGYRGELGLGSMLDLRARAYDARLGRFTSRDPVPGDSPYGGQPANPYAYAGNDPVNFTDPLGTLFVASAGGSSGAVQALVPPAVSTPRPAGNQVITAHTVAALALAGTDYTTMHNLASFVGSAVLAAQLVPQYGLPSLVDYGLAIDGAPKRLRVKYTRNRKVPPATAGVGYADVQFTYDQPGLQRLELWETKIASKGVNQAANLALREATWYSQVFNQRAFERVQLAFAEPGPWMAIPAAVPVSAQVPGGPGVLEVFSQPGKRGGIIYRVQPVSYRPPLPYAEYKYDPATKKLERVAGPSLTPGQIDAEKIALGAAGLALLVGGVYVAAAAAAWLIEALSTLIIIGA